MGSASGRCVCCSSDEDATEPDPCLLNSSPACARDVRHPQFNQSVSSEHMPHQQGDAREAGTDNAPEVVPERRQMQQGVAGKMDTVFQATGCYDNPENVLEQRTTASNRTSIASMNNPQLEKFGSTTKLPNHQEEVSQLRISTESFSMDDDDDGHDSAMPKRSSIALAYDALDGGQDRVLQLRVGTESYSMDDGNDSRMTMAKRSSIGLAYDALDGSPNLAVSSMAKSQGVDADINAAMKRFDSAAKASDCSKESTRASVRSTSLDQLYNHRLTEFYDAREPSFFDGSQSLQLLYGRTMTEFHDAQEDAEERSTKGSSNRTSLASNDVSCLYDSALADLQVAGEAHNGEIPERERFESSEDVEQHERVRCAGGSRFCSTTRRSTRQGLVDLYTGDFFTAVGENMVPEPRRNSAEANFNITGHSGPADLRWTDLRHIKPSKADADRSSK